MSMALLSNTYAHVSSNGSIDGRQVLIRSQVLFPRALLLLPFDAWIIQWPSTRLSSVRGEEFNAHQYTIIFKWMYTIIKNILLVSNLKAWQEQTRWQDNRYNDRITKHTTSLCIFLAAILFFSFRLFFISICYPFLAPYTYAFSIYSCGFVLVRPSSLFKRQEHSFSLFRSTNRDRLSF